METTSGFVFSVSVAVEVCIFMVLVTDYISPLPVEE